MRRAVQLQVLHHNRLLRECLVAVLADIERFEVDGVDHTCASYRCRIEQQRPDVLLVGSRLPEDPAQLIDHVRRHVADAKVLLLASPGRENLVECIAAGAHGCVLEECSVVELHAAIEKVLAGEVFCSEQLLSVMFERLSASPSAARWPARAKSVGLTPRELEIVYLIAERLSNKEIARRLSVSVYTIKNHVHNIIEKLQVADRFGAVEYAQRHHLLDDPRHLGPAEMN